jgi:O-antigen/teichoic acid export membrane protein
MRHGSTESGRTYRLRSARVCRLASDSLRFLAHVMPSRMFQKIKPSDLVRSLLGSSALRAACVLGVSGLALACGNLVLARTLPTDEFARFSLLFAIVMIGITVGPIGADVALTRQRFDPGAKLHGQVLLTSSAVGAVLATISGLLYPLHFSLLAAIFVSVAAGGVKVVAVSHYRSQQRFAVALALTVSTHASVLFAAGAAVLFRAHSALLPAEILAGVFCAAAIVGWWAVSAERQHRVGAGDPYPWGDGWSAVSFTAAGMILMSLDRLVTPRLLTLQALATLSVLATLAVSPFTILNQGIGYTLVPGLRNATNHRARRRVFMHESAVVGVTCIAAGLVAWWLTPLVLKYVLSDKYHISRTLLLVAICGGLLRIGGSLPASAVNAIGSATDLVKLSVAGWFAIVVALVGAVVGSHWGLTGLVFGIGAGWLARAVAIGWLAAPLLADAVGERG